MNKTNRTDINYISTDGLIAARAKFAKSRKKTIHHAPSKNAKLTKPSGLIKGRIEFLEHRIKLNHMISEIIEKRLNKNKSVDLFNILTKMTEEANQVASL